MSLTPEERECLTPTESAQYSIADAAVTSEVRVRGHSLYVMFRDAIRDLARTRLALKQEREKSLKLCQSLRDLAVDKALGKEHRASYFCRICKAVFEPIRMNWARGMCPVCSSWSAPDKTKAVASRAWSTSPEAVGEMMQWLAKNTGEGAIHFCCSQCHPDHMEPTFAVTIAPDNPADSLCYESLPLALAKAVCEVAKRKEALKP